MRKTRTKTREKYFNRCLHIYTVCWCILMHSLPIRKGDQRGRIERENRNTPTSNHIYILQSIYLVFHKDILHSLSSHSVIVFLIKWWFLLKQWFRRVSCCCWVELVSKTKTIQKRRKQKVQYLPCMHIVGCCGISSGYCSFVEFKKREERGREVGNLQHVRESTTEKTNCHGKLFIFCLIFFSLIYVFVFSCPSS